MERSIEGREGEILIIELPKVDRSQEVATRSSWKNFPIKNPVKVEMSWEFAEVHLDLIKRGYIPSEMEDKWFIFFEDDKIYFHRSWTGYGVFEAKVDKLPEDRHVKYFKYVIKDVLVESGFMPYSSESDIEELFMSILDSKLLRD